MTGIILVDAHRIYPSEDISVMRKLPDGVSVLGRHLDTMKSCGIERIIIATNARDTSWAGELPQNCTIEYVQDPAHALEDDTFLESTVDLQEDIVVVSGDILYSGQLMKRLLSCTRSAIVADFSSEYSQSKIAGHTVVAYDASTALIRPFKRGIEESFEAEGECYQFYKFFALDLERRLQYLIDHPMTQNKDTSITTVDFGDGIEVRILHAKSEEMMDLSKTTEETEVYSNFQLLQIQDQVIQYEPNDLLLLSESLERGAYGSAVLLCEQQLAEKEFIGLWRTKGMIGAEIVISGEVDRLTADRYAEMLRESGCRCLISVGGICVQSLANYLTMHEGKENLYHIALPAMDAIFTAAGAGMPSYAEGGKKLLPDTVIYCPAIDEEDTSISECGIFSFAKTLESLIVAGSNDLVTTYAETAINYAKGCMFAKRSNQNYENKAMYAMIWAARTEVIAGNAVISGIAEGLQTSDIPKHQAYLIAAAGLIDHLQKHLDSSEEDVRGRRVVANLLDEIGNLLEVPADEIVSVLADLLFQAGWDPAAYTSVPDVAAVAHRISVVQRKNTPAAVGKTELENLLFPWFQTYYSLCVCGRRRADSLTRRGYECRCSEHVTSYKAFKQMRWKYRGLYAKEILHKTFLDIFDTVSNLCQQKDLKYIPVGSTLMGAKLDENILPIADSFDLAMPEDDLRKLVAYLDEMGGRVFVKSPYNDPSCTFHETRVYLRGTQWIRLHNIYALGEQKEIYISIWPLVSAAGMGKKEKLAFRLSNMLSLILTHKRGEHHRQVGWKGKEIFKLTQRVPAAWLSRLHSSLNQNRAGEFYLCGTGRGYVESLLKKTHAFSSKQACLDGRVIPVPSAANFLYTDEDLERRISEKQNNFLMPGTYLLTNESYGVANLTVAEPAQKVTKAFSLIGELVAWSKRAVKRAVANTKRSAKLFIRRVINARKDFPDWYKKIAKPKVKAWLRTQFVRVFGGLRGMGLCLTKNGKILKSYRNKYAEQRCFLIGNGPSLCAEDLDKLQNEITLGCNFIHKIYPQTTWRPTYHFISDSSTVRTGSWDMVKNLDTKRTTMFIREFAYKFMYVKPSAAVVVPYVSTTHYKVHGNFLAYHYISRATVMTMMVEAAFYMGFKEIYLIGVDGTTASGKGGNFANNYFSPEQRAQLDKIKKRAIVNYDVFERRKAIQARQTMAYQKLSDYAEKHNIKIYNATRGGALEVFERADFDQVIGRKLEERRSYNYEACIGNWF